MIQEHLIGKNAHFILYAPFKSKVLFTSVLDPLGSVNFELSRSGSGFVIIVTDPDPYSFLATLFIKMIWMKSYFLYAKYA
jgi:hypothetical protein